MSSIGTGYDLSASQFSPDGRVFQVEYAQKAVENGGTVIGLRGEDGIVFAVEKIVTSKLYEPGTNKRIFNIDAHVGMAASGLISDAGQIAETARSEASSYRSQYGIPENDGPVMYMIDPSGVSYGYYGCAIGKAKQSAKTEIEKLKLSEMSCNELVKEAARIIYLVHDELKDKQFELEMSWVGKHTNGRHERVPLDIKSEAEAKAKQAMAEDSDSDTEDM
ncbi:PREDICTED: LOW QUALITY PROTEIN: proteasome subunit alpha type-3 [Dufourea novaeangliae]|uniref:LOW QUALITY PROTEIN: proteasome subunit alpha type-3 n=1 Tax=Dufourea novaeangliae TaxID=178035 RepID=UPI00076766A0|nr:PREDICTED: LOW QUALITY PROTEIN: proteasome subunit alpha type-3 [Dufourea novaeangliae]